MGECKLFHQNLDHGFSYVVAAGGLAAGLVQLTGEEHGKASPAQRHAAVLGADPQTEVVFLVELALLRALGRPAQMLAAGQIDLQVGIMLDTFHMNIEESSMTEAIRQAGPLLGHFHTGEPNRMPPGAGRMPWFEIGLALQSIGYEGPVVMEPFVRPGGTVGQNIKIWRDLTGHALTTEELDEMAKQAVQFQKYVLEC